MEPEAAWKQQILQLLRERNQRETGSFKDLILSHGRLSEQAEALKKQIIRLEFKNDEHEKEVEELKNAADSGGGGGGGSGAQVTKLTKRVEELKTKLITKTDELNDALKSKAELSTQIVENTHQLKDRDDKISSLNAQMKTIEDSNAKLHEKVFNLEETVKSMKQSTGHLQDEHSELQVEYNAQEKKKKALEVENDRLRLEVMRIKHKQAEDMNLITEKDRAARQKRIEEQLMRAAEPRSSFPRRPSRESGSISASTKHSVDPTAVYPSIMPDRVFFNTEAHDSEISALVFSPDGQYMATGGADKVVKVWTVRPTEEKVDYLATLHDSRASIMSIQFDHLSKLVLAASNDFAARVWTINDQRPRHTLTGHSGKVFAAKFLEDGNKVVTGSHDKTLKIWDLKVRRCSKTLFAGSSCMDLVNAHVLGNMIISGHWDRKIRFWDHRTSSVNPNHELTIQGRVSSLSLFPDRFMLLCSTRDDTSLRLIDLRQNAITSTFTGFHLPTDWCRASFSPDGQYVAAGSSDGSIHVWETMTGKLKTKKEPSVHTRDVIACSWHPRGQVFASVDRLKKLAVWKR